MSHLFAKRRTKAVVRKKDWSDEYIDDPEPPSIESPSRAADAARVSQMKAMAERSSLSDETLTELLKKDMSELSTLTSKPEEKSENQVVAAVKNAFAVFLIADFFLVLAFLAWFLAGVTLQSSNPVVLERFQDIFQPVVVPSLTVLMVGSFLSGDFGKEKK